MSRHEKCKVIYVSTLINLVYTKIFFPKCYQVICILKPEFAVIVVKLLQRDMPLILNSNFNIAMESHNVFSHKKKVQTAFPFFHSGTKS